MQISALIQAHNEAESLPDCLRSVTWVDELVVADHESTDATRAIALAAGARVIDMPALGFVEPTRQKAIEECTGDWIILLDADERVPALLAERLRALSQTTEAGGFWVPRKNYFLGQWMEHGFWPDSQLRFFRRSRIHWPELVHEHPLVDGQTEYLPADPAAALEHPGYGNDLPRFILKFVRCAPIDAERLARTLKPPVWPYLIRRPLGEFYGRYLQGQAWRHGMLGLVWSLLLANYQLLVAIHYWARTRATAELIEPLVLRRRMRWEAIRQSLKWLRLP